MSDAKPRCPDCADTGIISRPYIAGVVMVSYECPCALAKIAQEGKP